MVLLQVPQVVQRILAVRKNGSRSARAKDPQEGRVHRHSLRNVDGLNQTRNWSLCQGAFRLHRGDGPSC